MRESFKIEDNKISLFKDCKSCRHIKVCKFHSKMSELCKSNEFYQMQEYLEWNNTLEAFEKHSSCQFFERKFIIAEDKSVPLNVDRNIIDKIFQLEKPENCSGWSARHDEGNVIYYIKDSEELVVKIADLLKKYKFA